MKRKKILIVVGLLVVVAVALAVYAKRSTHTACAHVDMMGNCLPAGECVAPNDAIVDCEKLRLNPTKTDW